MLFLLTAALAVAPLAPDTLRLDSVYAELERRSPSLRASAAAARAAHARIGPVTRLPDPELRFETMNRRLSGLGLDPLLGMNQVSVMQMVPLGGRIGLSADAARARASAADQRVPESLLTLRMQAARQFYTLYRIDQSVAVIQDTRDLVRRLGRTTESMYAVGEGRQADVLRSQVELARMNEELIRMQAMRSAEAARLNGLLDRDPADQIEVVLLPDLDVELPEVDSLVALALRTRPMLRAARQDVNAATADERRAGRELWPELVLGATYGQRRMEGMTDRMVSFMIGASLPIWAGRRQQQMEVEARAMREMAQAELAAMEAETRARVTEVAAELARIDRLLDLYRGTVLPQSQAAVGSALSAYQVGSVDFMTLLDNQMAVNRYRLEVVTLTAERGIMLAEIEMLTGVPWVSSSAAVPAGGTQ